MYFKCIKLFLLHTIITLLMAKSSKSDFEKCPVKNEIHRTQISTPYRLVNCSEDFYCCDTGCCSLLWYAGPIVIFFAIVLICCLTCLKGCWDVYCENRETEHQSTSTPRVQCHVSRNDGQTFTSPPPAYNIAIYFPQPQDFGYSDEIEKHKDKNICFYFIKDIYGRSKLEETYCAKKMNCCDDVGCCEPTSKMWYFFFLLVLVSLFCGKLLFKVCCSENGCGSTENQPESSPRRRAQTQQNINFENTGSAEIRVSLLDDGPEDNSLRLNNGPGPSAPPGDAPLTPPPSYETAVSTPSLTPENRIPSYEDVMRASKDRRLST